ncbi:DUF3089 domain-containing protein [Sandarakinorhabdus sp.]|uniref:DUF3089 domain-containing protein n=1 Tax=Sandarakinorhabdus sp. TaxID=1916663 RepID=UPI00286E4426|nr:DUF3089 domain-containing protein [Sandarakinorhabdus sp.]
MRVFLAAFLLAAPVQAQSPPTYQAPDYANPASWLCQPGRTDACSGDITASVVAADGSVSLAAAPPAKAPPIDCFYVYPTVSTDATPNSDMTADPAETSVAQIQFAPMRGICRTFAPLYRQVTLTALRDRMTGKGDTADRVMAYRDIAAAWAHYLAHDNKGRGVILIGHSQGSGVLKMLIRNEIEGKPAASQMISAWLAGTNVLVPQGQSVGGDLKSTPLCTNAEQTGCVLAWVSWRDEQPIGPTSLFGRTTQADMEVACTNPAALGGGRAGLSALLPNRSAIVANSAAAPKWAKGRNIYTPFVALPGLLAGECMRRDGAHVLSVATVADPADPRTDTFPGDVVVDGQVSPAWGLHLVDMNVVMGDLVTLGRTQGAAWLQQQQRLRQKSL